MPQLTEGDLDRGQPPNLTSPHWRCGIVHAAAGAVCTRWPHHHDEQHQGYQAVPGARRKYLEENAGAVDVGLIDEELARIDAELPSVVGRRYDEAGMAAVNL